MAHWLQQLILSCLWHGLQATFQPLVLPSHWDDSHLVQCSLSLSVIFYDPWWKLFYLQIPRLIWENIDSSMSPSLGDSYDVVDVTWIWE